MHPGLMAAINSRPPRFRRAAAVIVVSDTLTRANAATLGNAETGQAWSDLVGTWGIASNAANVQTDGGADNETVLDAGVSDCSVQATFTNFLGDMRVVLRCTDLSNLFFARITSSLVEIYRRQAGVTTQIATAAWSGASGDTLKLSASGTALTAYVNGVQQCNATSSFNQTATKCGIGQGGGSDPALRIDNFLVTVP